MAMRPTSSPPLRNMDHRPPAALHRVGSGFESARSTFSASISRRLPSKTVRPSTSARAPMPSMLVKPVAGGIARLPRACRIACASGCSEPCSTAAASASTASSPAPGAATTSDHVGLAQGEGAGLVEDHDVELGRLLQRRGVLEQDAVHARRGRCRP